MNNNEETTFRKLKQGLIELLRGYPSHRFFGKLEHYLRESKSSLEVLKKDGIIEFASKKEIEELNKKLTPEQWEQLRAEGKKEPLWYRLGPRGVDLAISMINLGYSEIVKENSKKTIDYSEIMRKFTIAIVVIGGLTLLIQVALFGLSLLD